MLLADARAGLVVGTFEDVNPGVDTYQNDFPSDSFMTNGYTLNNSYDTTYGDWSGFAVSTMVDNQFGGTDYNHEYGTSARGQRHRLGRLGHLRHRL